MFESVNREWQDEITTCLPCYPANSITSEPELPRREEVPVLPHLPSFDLTRIMKRVAKDHPDWSAERLSNAEALYRKFCAIVKSEGPNLKTHILSNDMDQVWHVHILHTKQYAADCQDYLGFFMHHEPVTEGVAFEGADPCSRDYVSFRFC